MECTLFESWRQWRVCFSAGCVKFAWGLARIVTCIVLGLASAARWLWRLTVRFVGGHPSASIIIGLCVFTFVWVLTFVRMRHRAVSAEDQRDAIAWRFRDFKRSHGYE